MAPETELFNGNVWSAVEAKRLGLIDELGDMRSVMRERYGKKVRFRLVAERKSWLKRRFGLSSLDGRGANGSFGSVAEDLVAAIEARALWARYGL
jgi:serine protease SohB